MALPPKIDRDKLLEAALTPRWLSAHTPKAAPRAWKRRARRHLFRGSRTLNQTAKKGKTHVA